MIERWSNKLPLSEPINQRKHSQDVIRYMFYLSLPPLQHAQIFSPLLGKYIISKGSNFQFLFSFINNVAEHVSNLQVLTLILRSKFQMRLNMGFQSSKLFLGLVCGSVNAGPRVMVFEKNTGTERQPPACNNSRIKQCICPESQKKIKRKVKTQNEKN